MMIVFKVFEVVVYCLIFIFVITKTLVEIIIFVLIAPFILAYTGCKFIIRALAKVFRKKHPIADKSLK
jgi:hypothetical protein